MEKFLSSINLPLSDYLLMAVILTLFHVINVMELLSLKKEKEDPYYGSDLRFLSTLSFSGIVVTLICGVVAQNLGGAGDTLLMLVPVVFMLVWMYKQRRTSRLLDYERMDRHINEAIKEHLTSYALNNKQGFDLEKLENDFRGFIIANGILKKVKKGLSRKKYIPYMLVQDIMERLTFDERRITLLLVEMCDEGDLKYQGNMYIASHELVSRNKS
jgi:hypothetical protein